MIQPIGDRVLIKRDDDISTTPGGFIIPNAYTEKSDTGTVLAVGRGKQTDKGEFIPVGVSVGDRVIFQKNYGIDMKIKNIAMKINEDNCVMVHSYNILAVVEE